MFNMLNIKYIYMYNIEYIYIYKWIIYYIIYTIYIYYIIYATDKLNWVTTPKKTTEKSNQDGDTKGQRQPVFAMLEPKVNKMYYWTLTGKEGFINE